MNVELLLDSSHLEIQSVISNSSPQYSSENTHQKHNLKNRLLDEFQDLQAESSVLQNLPVSSSLDSQNSTHNPLQNSALKFQNKSKTKKELILKKIRLFSNLLESDNSVLDGSSEIQQPIIIGTIATTNKSEQIPPHIHSPFPDSNNINSQQQYTQFLQLEITRLKNKNQQYENKTLQLLSEIPHLHSIYEQILKQNQQLQKQLLCNEKKCNKLEYRNRENSKYYELWVEYLENENVRTKKICQKYREETQDGRRAYERVVRKERLLIEQTKLSQNYISALKQLLYQMITNHLVPSEKQQIIHCLQQIQKQYSQQVLCNKLNIPLKNIQTQGNLTPQKQVQQEKSEQMNKKENEIMRKSQTEERKIFEGEGEREMISMREHKFILGELRKQYEGVIEEIIREIEGYRAKNVEFEKKIEQISCEFQKHIKSLENELGTLQKNMMIIDSIKTQNKNLKNTINIHQKQINQLTTIQHNQQQIIKQLTSKNNQLAIKLEELQLESDIPRYLTPSSNKEYQKMVTIYKKLSLQNQVLKRNESQIKSTLKNVTVEFEKLKIYLSKIKGEGYLQMQKNMRDQVCLPKVFFEMESAFKAK